MPLAEPTDKRVIAFIDGQNLYRSAKECFGYHFPSYDALKLSASACGLRANWNLVQVRFYTGVPLVSDSHLWNKFWGAKLSAMTRQGVYIFSRPVRNGKEKGIDVQIAIDVIGLAHRNQYDVALIFSQDQDLSGVVEEIKTIAKEQDRWIRVACAFPYVDGTAVTSGSVKKRGINGTEWIQLSKELYDTCIDPKDYRASE